MGQGHTLVQSWSSASSLLAVLPICDHRVLLSLLVQLCLQHTHPYHEDLVGQPRLDVLLEMAQEKGTENLIQAADNEQRLLFI